MNKTLIKRWVRALRSGDYIQGKGYLCTSNANSNANTKYCCLGVLADVALDAYWELAHTDSKSIWALNMGQVDDDGIGCRDGLLPGKALQALGLSHDAQCHLARCNDRGDSFDKIADWIEANSSRLEN